jgi:hypothetical protein
MLSENDNPSWVMGTISTKMGQPDIARCRQKSKKLDELTHPRWGDAADYFRERDKKSSIPELNVLPFVVLQTDQDAATPALTTFGEHI